MELFAIGKEIMEQVSEFLWEIYNPVHNILELFKVIVQVPFTTSERKLDI